VDVSGVRVRSSRVVESRGRRAAAAAAATNVSAPGADDGTLLEQFVATGSQQAFALLVRRHVDLVYAAARRRVRALGGDSALADDVTQAVFMILARRAATVRTRGRAGVLPAWLLSTTRYAATNAVTLETRRRRHEQGAAVMKRLSADAAPPPGEIPDPLESLSPSLDDALAKLGEPDRAAVAMRFLEGRSFREVGAALGASVEAAQMRVARALGKLRAFFGRRGVTIEAAALASGLARYGATAAPATLAPLVIANALGGAASAASAATAGTAVGAGGAGGAVGAGKASAIAHATARTLVASKLKVAAGVVAATVATAAAGVTLMSFVHPEPPPSVVAAAPTAVVPNPLWQPRGNAASPVAASAAGDAINAIPFRTIAPGELTPMPHSDLTKYRFGVDLAVTRAGNPAAFVASLAPDADTLAGPGARVPADRYRGRRVRFSTWLKTRDVRRMAGVQLQVIGPEGRVIARDGIGTAPVSGTTADWVECASVVDVPPDAVEIRLAAVLWGSGTLWTETFQLSEVPRDAETTDDARWRMFTPFARDYTAAPDPAVRRSGHRASIRMSRVGGAGSGGGGGAGGGEWTSYTRIHAGADLERFRGKTVRISAWICSADVGSVGGAGAGGPGGAGVFLNATRNTFPQLATTHGPPLPIRGTLPWFRYTATLKVPAEADVLESGVILRGGGTVWIDEVTYEIVPEQPTARPKPAGPQ
jgi:RNA polymerase sigma factor (sigma-70 family)